MFQFWIVGIFCYFAILLFCYFYILPFSNLFIFFESNHFFPHELHPGLALCTREIMGSKREERLLLGLAWWAEGMTLATWTGGTNT